MVLNWNQGIGGAIGLWPLSDRSAARLTNAQMKEADVTGRMMRRSAKHRLATALQLYEDSPTAHSRIREADAID
jgi:hypothetical protein